MNGPQCSQRSHLPRPGRPHRQSIPRRESVLCDPCVEKLNAMGMDWRPVEEPFVAPWRRQLTARDETGATR